MQWSKKYIHIFSCFFYNICHTLLLYYLLLSTLSCWNTSKIKPHRSAGPWEIFYASQRWQWWLFDIKLYCFIRFFQDLIWEWWLWVKRWVTAIRNGNNWICLENIELVFLLYLKYWTVFLLFLPLTTAGWQELIRHIQMQLFSRVDRHVFFIFTCYMYWNDEQYETAGYLEWKAPIVHDTLSLYHAPTSL